MNSSLDLQDESDITSYEFRDYDLLRYRGGGSYAHVFDSKNKWSGQNVVVKTLSKYEVDEQRSLLERGISLLQRLSGSPHVIALHQVVEDTKAGYTHMIYEVMDCDLEALMRTKDGMHKTISRELMRSFLHQICQGVADCHSRGVIHRDLKTANLLVDEKASKIKIADFGLGRLFTVFGETPTPGQAALCYRAPEILLNSTKLYASADMWSVGCIFGEMLLGKTVFDAQQCNSRLLSIKVVVFFFKQREEWSSAWEMTWAISSLWASAY